jgi:DNA-binding beta-propeller fold protein YncE
MKLSIVLLAGAALAALTCASASAATAAGYHVVDRIAGPDGGWDYAAVDAKAGRVLVARGPNIMTVDMKTRAVKGDFAHGARTHAAMPIDGGEHVLITNGQADTATIADSKTGAILSTIATGKNPDAAAFDTATGLILVMNHTGGDVTLIDPKAQKAVGTIAIGGTLEAAAVDGAGKAYVNVEDKGEIAVIDLKSKALVTRYKLAGCEGPTGIAYAPAEKLLITTCDGVAQVIAAATGKLVASIKIGEGADGVAFDPVRKLAFVPSGDTGTLSVISIANGSAKLVETVPTQTGARTIAFDQQSGRLYLPTAKFGPAPAGGGRAPMIPGSFELLVVGK